MTNLDSHLLGREGEADCDSGQKALRHVGDNDTNEEDDSIQPIDHHSGEKGLTRADKS